MTKQDILNELKTNSIGFFLDKKDKNYKPFADLDGKHAKEYLESKGFKVIAAGDTGNNGYALTSEGVYLSTNGYCYLRK